MARLSPTSSVAVSPDPFTPARAETVRLRQANEADAAKLALVGAATFLEAFTWMLPGDDIVAHCARHHTPEAYQRYLQQPETRITLAEAMPGGAPVGYAMLATPDLPTFAVQASDSELKRIYLFSRFRGVTTPVLPASESTAAEEGTPGLRAGQALMDAAIDDARAMGKRRLLLGTHAGNQRAIAFYRKNGFHEAGTRTFQVGAQVCSDLIFSKEL